MTATKKARKYITPEEAALALGVHTQTVRRWIKGAMIPFRQVGGKGGRILIPKKWLAECERKPI